MLAAKNGFNTSTAMLYFNPDLRDEFVDFLNVAERILNDQKYCKRKDLLPLVRSLQRNLFRLRSFEIGSLRRKGTPVTAELYWVSGE